MCGILRAQHLWSQCLAILLKYPGLKIHVPGLLVEEAVHTLLRFKNVTDDPNSWQVNSSWYLPLDDSCSSLAPIHVGAGLSGYIISAWMSHAAILPLSEDLLNTALQVMTPNIISII